MSNKKSSTAIDDEKKKASNLYNALGSDSKSVFYTTDIIATLVITLVRKARNSLYRKDIVFVNIYNGLENNKILLEKVPLIAPFVEKKQNIIRTMLYSFSRPFEALQSDIAYISFLARSAVDPKFSLLFVDFLTSKIYKYPIKKINLLAKKNRIILQRQRKKRLGKKRLNKSEIETKNHRRT